MNRNYLRKKKQEQIKQKIVSGILYGIIIIIAIVALCKGLSHNNIQKSHNDTVPVTQTHTKSKRGKQFKHHRKQVPMQIQSTSNHSNSDNSSNSDTYKSNHINTTNNSETNNISKKNNGNNNSAYQHMNQSNKDTTSVPVHEQSAINNHSENTNNLHSTTPEKSQRVVMKKIN